MSKPLLELVLFSDMHAHNFRYGAKRTTHPNSGSRALFNSRLVDCVKIIQQIEQYCLNNKIKHVLFGGDMFHTRSSVKTDVFNLVYNEIADIKHLQFTMIPGNHDYGDRAGNVHSLSAFKRLKHVTVMDSVDWVMLDDKVAVIGVPYTDDPAIAKERLEFAGELARTKFLDKHGKLLLAHLGMQGAKVGSDYVLVSDSDVQVVDVPYDDFTACFFGHYHQHQKLFPNGWFIGSTHHHNWGDANTTRGFLHAKVYADRVTFEQIPTEVPRFLNVVEGEADSVDIHADDFVRYHTKGSAEPLDTHKLRALLGAHQVELIEHAEDAELEEFVLPEDSLEPRALVDIWTEAKVPEEDMREAIAELGKALLAEAEGRML